MSQFQPNIEEWEIISHHGVSPTATSYDDGEKEKQPPITGLHASLLIPGRGHPTHNQAILMQSGLIIHIGPPDSLPKKYAHVHLQKVPVVMPGMWECHSHFMGASPEKPIDSESLGMTNPAEAGARNARAMKDVLYAGFTSCIDLGGYAPELQTVIDEGLLLGPTLYGAGAAISMTAGHGEVFEIPFGSAQQKLSVHAPGTDAGSTTLLLADGPTEVRKAVRMNLRRGARVIKVFTSGGATSRDDDPQYQQFSDEELSAIVDEASRMGLACAAHAVGLAGIKAALRAGFKVIEHGSWADKEVLKEMKDKNVLLVATMTPLESVLAHKSSYPAPMVRKVEAIAKVHYPMYRAAVSTGVRCATGSDLFGGVGSVLSPGMNGREVPLAVKVGGMTPLQAIEAATANGPLTLGPQAPKSGKVEVGFEADLLGLEESPVEDVEVLSRPGKIRWIWKGGRLVKAPGLDPWSVLEG